MVLETYLQIRACLGLAEQLAAHETGSVPGLSIAAGSSTIDDISAFPYMCREIPKCVSAMLPYAVIVVSPWRAPNNKNKKSQA